MTKWGRFFAFLTVAAWSTSFVATPVALQAATTADGEPFHSFRLLDTKLTLLSNQQSDLKRALSAGGLSSSRGRLASPSLAPTLTRMSSTTAAIERITARLERLYQDRQEPFGVRSFRILRGRAQGVGRAVNSFRRARTQGDRSLAENRLDQQVVSLIIQFQAISGGYGATHCLPRTRICCQPKRSQDLLPGQQVACKWACVSHARACGGFLGPRIR